MTINFMSPISRDEKIRQIVEHYKAKGEPTSVEHFKGIRQSSIDEIYEALPKASCTTGTPHRRLG